MGNQWMVRAGQRGFLIDEFRSRSCVAVGYSEMGDISGLDTPGQIALRHEEAYPDLSKNQRGASLGQLKRFLFQFREGDGVVSYDPNAREYLIGRIVSACGKPIEPPPDDNESAVESVRIQVDKSLSSLHRDLENRVGLSITDPRSDSGSSTV